MKIIKIGIQSNGYPIWLDGEVNEEELKRIIRLLKIIKESGRKR